MLPFQKILAFYTKGAGLQVKTYIFLQYKEHEGHKEYSYSFVPFAYLILYAIL